MNEREYFRLKKEIHAEAERKLSALELVWAMSGKGNGKGSPKKSMNPSANGYGSLSKNVSEGAQIMPAKFSLDDLVKAKPDLATFRRSSIGTALLRLKDPKISVISKGRGKVSAVFQKV